MNFRTQWCLNGAARMVFRAAEGRLLPAIGVACIGFVLAGSSGFTRAQLQGDARIDGTSTHYTIQDLGVVGANANAPGQPFVISDNGWVAGVAAVGSALHAVLWHEGKMIDIGDPGFGGNSTGYGVNESGVATGAAEITAGDLSTTEDFCGFQATGFSPSPRPCVPVIFDDGKMVLLKTLGGVNGEASEINSSGAIAGYAENRTPDTNCTAPQKYQFKPVVWFRDRIEELPIGDDTEGVAISINDSGEVVGISGSCAPLNPITLFYLAPAHAWLWKDGRATDLGNLGGALNNFAHHINNLGQVVGQSDLAGDQTSHAFLWTRETNMQDLGTVNDAVNNDTFSFGLGINDEGEITGLSANADFTVIRAFVRRNGVLVDLNTLVTGNNSLYMITACSINSRGQIIGIAIDPNTNESHGYLATPTREASADTSNARRTPPLIPDSLRSQLRLAMRMQPD